MTELKVLPFAADLTGAHVYDAQWNAVGSLLALTGPAVDRFMIGRLRQGPDGALNLESLSGAPAGSGISCSWRPGTNSLACPSAGSLVFWDSHSGRTIIAEHPVSGLERISWSPDGRLLGIVTVHHEGIIYRVSEAVADLTEIARFENAGYPAIAWSPESDRIAYYADGDLVIASVADMSARTTLPLPPGALNVVTITWSPTGRTVAVTVNQSIHIFDVADGRLVAQLKSHTALVIALAFAPDERLLASAGWDGAIRLWAVDGWRLLKTIKVSPGIRSTNWLGLSFHPTLPLLCAPATDQGVSLYQLDVDALLAGGAVPTKRYATAKVVLVGESGVGKTGLAYRLATGGYKDHPSTHGQQFWVLDSLVGARSDGVRCEVVVWDLAGQPDYRLIHVLFLSDADLAIIVLDASRRHELLDVVSFWVKALDALRSESCVKVLVSARTDRGNAAISSEELQDYASGLGISTGLIETSALTGGGLPELAQAIRDHLRWDDLPVVVETPSLTAVKEKVLRLKEQRPDDQPIVTAAELSGQLANKANQAEVDVSIRDLQLHGFVHVLRGADGSDLVLLRPELLNNLAASLVLEARRNERGLGALDEAGVLAGRYRLPELDGLHEEQRRVLVESAVVLFLEYNICFREPLGEQVLLIFPELINEKPPALADAARFADDVTYLVTGSIQNVYASLVVLLGYTNVLRRRDQWRDQARYELDGHLLHFRQERRRDDRLEIVLSYPDGVPDFAKRVFQGLVEQFLRRSRVDIKAYPRVDCPECGNTLPREQVIRFVDKGAGRTFCPDDGHSIPLAREADRVGRSTHEQAALSAELTAATERTTFAVVATQLRGYLAEIAHREHSVTVFVSYPWGDPEIEDWVRERLVPDLKQVEIEVILDRTDSRVGGNVARFVERLSEVDRVIVVATPSYARKYTNATGAVVAAEADVINLRMLGTEEQKATVLPVLLAGEPEESLPTLMRTRIYADFRNPDHYFVELFELIMALHDLPPETPALRDLRLALRRPRRP